MYLNFIIIRRRLNPTSSSIQALVADLVTPVPAKPAAAIPNFHLNLCGVLNYLTVTDIMITHASSGFY